MKKRKVAVSLLAAFMILAEAMPTYGAQADVMAAQPATEVLGEERPTDTQDSEVMPYGQETDTQNSEVMPYGQETDTQNSEVMPYEQETETEEDYVDYNLQLQNGNQTLKPGETVELNVSTNVPASELTYESSAPAVAKVSADGLVTAVGGGAAGSAQAVITVRYRDKISASCVVTVQNTLTISKTSLVLYAGGSEQLAAASLPAGGITWRSSKPTVAVVNASGKVTAKKAGRATITAEAHGVSVKCEVTVKKATLKLKSRATVYLRNPQSLGAEALPAGRIKWSSSNKKIATVNAKGVVTGRKKGKVTITAKANGVTKKCRVTVKAPSVSFNSTSAAMFKDSSAKLSVSAKPSGTVKWKSSNSKVVKVDKQGVITGKKAGTAKITAYVNGAKSTCTVNVLKNPYSLSFEQRMLMVEDTASLYVKGLGDEGNPTFHVESSDGCVTIKSDGNECTIKAVHKGQATISASFSTYVKGNLVSWSAVSKIEVVDTGISRQQFSLAKNGTQQLTLVNVGEETIQSVSWSSSNPSVASIDAASGMLKAENAGTAQITAAAVYQDGRTASYTTEMKVSDPKVKGAQVTAALGGKKKIQLTGTNIYSSIKWKSKKSSIATVNADGTIVPRKKGTVTVEITVDGQVLPCKVYVSNPRLKEDYKALAPGKSTTISLKGLSSKSTVTYKSSNKNAATVSAKGKIKAKGYGKTEITVNADGKSFRYLVEVAPQAAINAVNEAYSIMYSSTYSQAYRMSAGHYDCSSLVFRAYKKNTSLLGGIASWAPTAAGMAQYMAQTGKVLSYGSVDVSELLPGDLIFYGNSANGRYRGIYHVSMYYGNGNRLEKPIYPYYPGGNIVMVARPVR